jgi:hypothetical protein
MIFSPLPDPPGPAWQLAEADRLIAAKAGPDRPLCLANSLDECRKICSLSVRVHRSPRPSPQPPRNFWPHHRRAVPGGGGADGRRPIGPTAAVTGSCLAQTPGAKVRRPGRPGRGRDAAAPAPGAPSLSQRKSARQTAAKVAHKFRLADPNAAVSGGLLRQPTAAPVFPARDDGPDRSGPAGRATPSPPVPDAGDRPSPGPAAPAKTAQTEKTQTQAATPRTDLRRRTGQRPQAQISTLQRGERDGLCLAPLAGHLDAGTAPTAQTGLRLDVPTHAHFIAITKYIRL